MASILKIPGKKLQARISTRDDNGNYKRILKSLGTKDRAVAEERLLEVEKVETLIRQGQKVDFWWMSGESTQVKHQTLQETVKIYKKYIRQERLKSGTIEVYELALKYLQKVLGKKFRISQISEKDIDKYKALFPSSRSPNTVNKNLRAIKSFLIWSFERGYINKVPRIKMIRTPRARPSYINEAEFKLILAKASPFMAKVFEMYLETGMRLSSPFIGEIRGFFLEISGSVGKNGIGQEIPLKLEHIELIAKMKILGWLPKSYSRAFWQACKDAEVTGKRFNSLRHTFALRTWLKTGDLYLTAKLMSHTSVQTTLIYTQFHISKLQADFPSLVKETSRVIPFKKAVI